MGAPLSSFFLFLSLAFSSSLAFHSKCLPDFNTKKKQFDICLEKECFIFRSEKPYVFLDDELNRTNNQVPFPCIAHKQRWPGLDGVFFELIEHQPQLSSTYCVFAGRDCTFNGMISFINSSASSHQWIGGGVLFVLQNRILPGVVPSTSILEDYLHIVGPPRKPRETFQEASSLVLKPFSWQAWLVFLSVLAFFGLVRVIMVFLFGSTRKWAGFLRTLFLFNLKRDVHDREEREEGMWSALDRHWGVAFIIFSSIMLLLYEVALAVIAFEAVRNPPVLDLRAEQFAVYANTTEEYFFRLMVKNSTDYSKFNTLDAVYDNLLKNDSLSYTVSYGIDNRYKFTSQPELCEFLRLYDTVPEELVPGRKPPPITGVWFYSAKIPPERRMVIDKAILELKELGRVKEFVDIAVGGREVSSQCKPSRTQITWFILFMLVALPILYLIGISIAIAVAHYGYRPRPPNESAETLPVTASGSTATTSNRCNRSCGSTISAAAATPTNDNNVVNAVPSEVRRRTLS